MAHYAIPQLERQRVKHLNRLLSIHHMLALHPDPPAIPVSKTTALKDKVAKRILEIGEMLP